MSLDSLSRHIYELRYKVKFLELKGNAFEDFFSEVMEKKHGGDFMRCRPWGKRGDRKNDGYLKSERMLFQVYAPNEMKEDAFKKKVKADFRGAERHWKKYFDKWIFVHNSKDGLGPEQVKLLFELDDSHANISVVHWGFEDIRKEVFDLSKEDLAALLGPIDLFETIQDEEGKTIQEATKEGFLAELDQVAEETKQELQRRAEDNYNAGKSYGRDHCYKDAAASYKKSVDALPTMSAYLNLGISYLNISDYPNAESAFTAGFGISKTKQSQGFQGAFLGNMGVAHLGRGSLAKAIELFMDAHNIHKKLGSLRAQSRDLCNIGNVYFERGELDDALQAYEAAHEIGRSIAEQADPLCNIANIYFIRGRLKKAQKAYDEAHEIYERNGNPRGQADTLINSGNVHFALGELDIGIEVYRKAFVICQNIQNPQRQAGALCGLGNIYDRQGKTDDALEAYQDALEIHRQIGDLRGEARIHGCIGNIYGQQRKLKHALKAYNDALKIHRKLEDPSGQAKDLTGLAILLQMTGNLENSLPIFQMALELEMAVGDVLGQADTFGNIGNVYRKMGDKKVALEHFHRARDIFIEHGFRTEGRQTVEKHIRELERDDK